MEITGWGIRKPEQPSEAANWTVAGEGSSNGKVRYRTQSTKRENK